MSYTTEKYEGMIAETMTMPGHQGDTIHAYIARPLGPGPFPGVFEFLPYRKDDRTAARWNAHQYFAERGFVGVRADIRGTGGSEGVATDEYTRQEQQPPAR